MIFRLIFRNSRIEEDTERLVPMNRAPAAAGKSSKSAAGALGNMTDFALISYPYNYNCNYF